VAPLLKTEPALATSTTASATRGFGRLTPSSSSRIAGLHPLAAAKPSYYCSAVAQLSRSSTGGSAAGGGPLLFVARAALGTRLGACHLQRARWGHDPRDRDARLQGRRGALLRRGPQGRLRRLASRDAASKRCSATGVAGSSAGRCAAPLPRRRRRRDVHRRRCEPQCPERWRTDLRRGWTLTSFGPAVGTSVLSDGSALALLIGGVLLSLLVGVAVFYPRHTAGGRRQSPAPAEPPSPPQEELYDPLTGLPNRALMLDRAQRMLARASRQSGLLIGALFVDNRLVQGRQREDRTRGGRTAAEDRHRAAGGRRPRSGQRRDPGRRRVRRARRVGRARRPPGVACPPRDRSRCTSPSYWRASARASS